MGHGRMGTVKGPPPSYDTIKNLKDKLKQDKAAGHGNITLAKNATGEGVGLLRQGICCLIFSLIMIGVFFLAVPIVEIVIGSLALNECPAEKYLPIFLMVSGVFGIAFGISCSSYGILTRNHEHAQEEGEADGSSTSTCGGCCGFCGFILGLFLFAWFICGNVWVFSMHQCAEPVTANSTGCFTSNAAFSNTSIYCKESLYSYTLWETVAKWVVVGVVALLCCLGCSVACCAICCCDDETED